MDEIQTYESLKKFTSAADLERLASKVATHLDRVEEAAFSNEFVQVDLAERLVAGVRAVLAENDQLDRDQRSAVRAAIDYFLLTDDADDDVSSPIGMEDDVRVWNRACEEIGRPDLAVVEHHA